MPDLGKKITCPKCTKKFYDMGRAELVCPSCRQQVDLSAQSNGKNTAKLAPEIDPDLEEFDESDEFDEDDEFDDDDEDDWEDEEDFDDEEE